MTHCLHITPPDAILKIGLSSAVGIIYLDSCYSTRTHVHKQQKQVHRGVSKKRVILCCRNPLNINRLDKLDTSGYMHVLPQVPGSEEEVHLRAEGAEAEGAEPLHHPVHHQPHHGPQVLPHQNVPGGGLWVLLPVHAGGLITRPRHESFYWVFSSYLRVWKRIVSFWGFTGLI